MGKKIWILGLLQLCASLVFSQTQDERLAQQYFEEENYALALPYYENLAESRPEDLFLYDRYLQCLLELKEYDKSKKLVKKRTKKFESVMLYQVDIGYILEKEGKVVDAENAYNHVLNGLGDNYIQYNQLVEAFKQRSKMDYAIKTLEKGETTFEGFSDFGSQLALLYLETGNRSKGIEKYVNIVLNSGLPPDQTRQFFEMNLTDSMDYAILRLVLLKQIQKSPDNYILADLLKWTFIKQKDWNAAFVQTRALDKRLKEEGLRVSELGELCMSNEAWEAAAQCFQYVKELGEDKPYYTQAHVGLLETRYGKLKSGKANTADMLELEKDFSEYINKQGFSEYNWRAVSALSDLYTRYLHVPGKSIDLLESYVKSNNLRPKTIAAAKLALGDAYVIDGDVWSSELLYAQVELDYEEEALGQEAKFRRARLSYFRGDFTWAKLQLDVLKGATTQLISNNAIELALKISENLGIDSNYHALELYAKAELLLEQNLLSEAESSLDSIIKLYPGHSLSDDILYTRAEIREKQGLYAEAANLYETLAIAFAHDLLADNAWFKLGTLYEFELAKPEKAMECYKKILLDFPGSLYQSDARKNFRRLRGDQI